MGINQATAQGMLNRLRGSVIVNSNSSLNITSDYLSTDGIVLEPQETVTDILDTMTGTVGSQKPKLRYNITINLNRAQALANSWWNQVKKDTQLGTVRIVSDSPLEDDVTIQNCFIVNVPQQTYSGMQVAWPIVISGYVIVNANLWNLS